MMSIKRYKDGDFLPLNKYDFCRRTDANPEYQDGTGASVWIAAAVVCNILLVIIGVCYG